MTRRIPVLTAAYGEGHNSAAVNLVAALGRHAGVHAEVVDPLRVLGEAYDDSRRRYVSLVNRAPWVWRAVYHLLEAVPLERAAASGLARVEAELEPLLESDAIVATHPLYPVLLSRLRRRGRRIPPVTLVVTDSISVNRVWSRVEADWRLCADRYSARVLVRQGCDASRVAATGFPVCGSFSAGVVREVPGSGTPARVLLVAGTAAHRTEETAEAVSRVPGVALTVTTGHDAALGESVRRRLSACGAKAEVLGWTGAMPALLRSHHIVLGKAGGATTHETFAARTPFVITRVLPGQEEGNARLVERLGVGEVAASPEAAAESVRRTLADGAVLWRRRVDRLACRTRVDGAARAAAAVLGSVR